MVSHHDFAGNNPQDTGSCHLTVWIAQGHQQGSKDPAITLASGEWPWTGHAELTLIWESHSDSITSLQMPVHLLWFTNSILIKSVVFVILWYVFLIYILDRVDAVVDMANWTIPPCISNFKNEGGTPLDCKLWGVRWNFHWYLSFNLCHDDSKSSMISKISCVEVWWVFFRQIIHISCNLQYLIRKITHFPTYPGIPESLPPTRQAATRWPFPTRSMIFWSEQSAS